MSCSDLAVEVCLEKILLMLYLLGHTCIWGTGRKSDSCGSIPRSVETFRKEISEIEKNISHSE